MKEVAANIYVESGYQGVTVGAIVTGDGVICIDSPLLPSEARDWQARLAKLTNQPIRQVIYTDANRDRVLSGQYLGGAVVMHDLAHEMLESYGDAFRQQIAESLSRCAPQDSLEIITNLHLPVPQVTFSKHMTLTHGASSIILQHVGGASPGSLFVLLPDQNVLFAGDLVTVNTHPHMADADFDRWIELLKSISQKPPKYIIPGRGGVLARKGDLKKLLTYLRSLCTRIRSLIRSKRSRFDTAALIQDFLPRFPVTDSEREAAQRRIRAGLEHAFDFYNK
jgi:glyoxylase-like metal-dependent hydrolase (beta-lactamase superfamily II)